jgi:hypothetical protein
MNYQRIHDAIIDRASNRTLQGYREKHHVIPRCMGGVDTADNLVELTAREHFIIHKLLVEIYPDDNKIFFAYRMMALMRHSKDNDRTYYVSSREFERIRLLANIKIGDTLRGRKLGPRSIESIDKQIKTKQLNGYMHSDETKRKISAALTNKPKSNDHRKNLSTVLKNNPKVTGKASTPEKEMLRRQKIKDSWTLRKKGGQLD